MITISFISTAKASLKSLILQILPSLNQSNERTINLTREKMPTQHLRKWSGWVMSHLIFQSSNKNEPFLLQRYHWHLQKMIKIKKKNNFCILSEQGYFIPAMNFCLCRFHRSKKCPHKLSRVRLLSSGSQDCDSPYESFWNKLPFHREIFLTFLVPC